jgi:hypothetical protein
MVGALSVKTVRHSPQEACPLRRSSPAMFLLMSWTSRVWSVIRRRPLVYVLLLLGTVFLALGITQGFNLPVVKRVVANPATRGISLIVGGVFVLAGVALYYLAPAENGDRKQPSLIRSFPELKRELLAIVAEAKEWLGCTGSRSRDEDYLDAIKNALRKNPELIHYRVLFGAPRHPLLKQHLLELLEFRDPDSRAYGQKTIHLGLYPLNGVEPERFICANEKKAVMGLPALAGGPGKEDMALLVTDADDVEGVKRYVHALYGRSELLEDRATVKALRLAPKSRSR